MTTKIPLNQKLIPQLERAIHRTWCEIAPDAWEFVESNDDAMEFVLDADRMYSVDLTAHKLVDDLCAEHGYTKVLTFLSRNIRLF